MWYYIITEGEHTNTDRKDNTMKYYDLTNKELLNAYNASTEYDEAMCCEICTGSVCILIITMQMARASTGLWKKQSNSLKHAVK